MANLARCGRCLPEPYVLVLRSILTLILGLVVGCTPLINNLLGYPIQPTPQALEYFASTAGVSLEATSYGWAFVPRQPARGGLAFYASGFVDVRAYAPILRLIAEGGYRVALIETPLYALRLESEAALVPIQEEPRLKWAIGGHSLGGEIAADFVAKHPGVNALVLWVAIPQKDLSYLTVPTLALFAQNDGFISVPRRMRESRKLPGNTQSYVLQGFNHSAFGGYPSAAVDGRLTMPPQEAWQTVADLVLPFLNDHLGFAEPGDSLKPNSHLGLSPLL